jgi:hypothetical protein
VERGGRWHVAGGVQGARERAPWEADRYERRSSGHFVVWVPRGIEPAGLPEALADGYRRLRATLRGGTLRRRYLVVVARDPGHARRMTASIRGLRGLTALTDTEVRVAGPAERVTGVASQRLLVLWPAFSALDPETQRQTVTHELTHAALAPVTSGRVPGWLAEGVAMYVAGDRRAIEPGGPSLASLSAPDAIARRAGVSQGRAYALASAAAFHIGARYGSARLLALYEAFGRPSLRGRAGDPALVDRALRRVLGIGLRRLQRDLG